MPTEWSNTVPICDSWEIRQAYEALTGDARPGASLRHL